MSRSRLLACVLLLVSPALLVAQESPAAGTWGAETDGGGAALLRFRSPTSAWMLGFSANFQQRERDPDGPGLDTDTKLTTAEISLGIRSYRRPAERTRPFTSLSGIVGYQELFDRSWLIGAQLETGAAHFFSRHVSLGTALGIRATYGRGTATEPITGEVTTTTIDISTGLRFLGAVYF